MKKVANATLIHTDIKMAGEGLFISTMLATGLQAHVLHLRTKSYAAHVALGSYYEAIPGIMDSIAESMQGHLGSLLSYAAKTTIVDNGDPLKLMTDTLSYVRETRKKLPQVSFIQNQIDTIEELICSTIYKLKFLS